MAMTKKMESSEGFIEKSFEVQIQEILKEGIPSTQKNVVHYYVDVEGGEDTPYESEARTS